MCYLYIKNISLTFTKQVFQLSTFSFIIIILINIPVNVQFI